MNRGSDLRIVLISKDLIINLLKHGTRACKAIKGIPQDARLMDARFDSAREVVELRILSQLWNEDDEDDEIFTPLFTPDEKAGVGG
jgi:hypothetical protein